MDEFTTEPVCTKCLSTKTEIEYIDFTKWQSGNEVLIRLYNITECLMCKCLVCSYSWYMKVAPVVTKEEKEETK
jgi:hypothetical protein